jgi:hypothetical protein
LDWAKQGAPASKNIAEARDFVGKVDMADLDVVDIGTTDGQIFG